MHPDIASSCRPTGWIISPLADITLLLASPLAIVPAVFVAARHFSPEFIFLVVGSFASIGHHLPGFLRAYGDPALFRRFRWRFLLAPPLVLATAILFTSRKFHGLTLILFVWATWHIIMQTYGLMRIYDLKRGIRAAWDARMDFCVCAAMFVAGILFSQARLFSILEIFQGVGIGLAPPKTIAVLRWTLGTGIGIVLVAYAIQVLCQTRAAGPSWAKLALLMVTGALYWSCGSLSTNLLIGVALFEVFHAVQYNALVWSYNRRMADREGTRFGPLRFMFAGGWLPVAMYLAVIAAFGSLKWFTESLDHSAAKTLLLTLLLTSTALHFYFDGFIWKVSERETQRNLGFDNGGRMAGAVTALKHMAKWGSLAAVVVVLFWVEASAAPRTDAQERAWVNNVSRWTPDLPEVLMRQAQLALAAKDGSTAVDAARRAVQLLPNSPEARLLLVKSLVALRDFPAANEAAMGAVALCPDSAEANYQLGLIDVQLRNFITAEFALRRSLASNGVSADTHLQLGNVYFLTGRPELAEQCFRRAVELSPGMAEGHGNLGSVLLQMGRVSEARQSLVSALGLGDNAQCHYNLALILLNEGGISAARAHFVRSQQLGQPISPELRMAAGL